MFGYMTELDKVDKLKTESIEAEGRYVSGSSMTFMNLSNCMQEMTCYHFSSTFWMNFYFYSVRILSL